MVYAFVLMLLASSAILIFGVIRGKLIIGVLGWFLMFASMFLGHMASIIKFAQ